MTAVGLVLLAILFALAAGVWRSDQETDDQPIVTASIFLWSVAVFAGAIATYLLERP